MQYSLNLRALAAEAFGLTPLMRFQLPPEPEPEPASTDLYGTPLAPNQEGTGLLGLPVFQRIAFLAPSGFVRLTLDDPIVTIDRDKFIVTTEIQGRNGTVKEYISHGDYQVSIKGILAPPVSDGRFSRRYPEAEVQALKQLCDEAAALPVNGRLFKLFGIHNLVIKGVSWPPLNGFTNLQAYELRCLSDEPVELIAAGGDRLTFNTTS